MSGEIIIGGVNVAECNAYKDKHCKDKTAVMFCETNLCSNFPDYYKQFKRLEKENDELRKQIKDYKINRRCAWKSFENSLCEEGEKYKQTLQEIKAIATGVRSYLEVPAPRDVRFEMDRILNLINETESPD